MIDLKILLLIKPTSWGKLAKEFIEKKFPNNLVLTADWGDPKPKILFKWEGDYIISFLSPWILPQEILNKAKIAAINFHPAPPEYPGIGCYNFAIYNDDNEYGATCHHMLRKVDSGQIITVKRFPIESHETVLSLKEKTMNILMLLFYEIMDIIIKGKDLPISSENWHRDAYTRKDFQDLCRLSLQMPEEELVKRLKATYFAGARDYPNIEIGGKIYLLVDPKELKKEL